MRARQVDFVDDGNNREVLLQRERCICNGLRLDALRRVDEQARAFAGSERTRNLVGKVHVPGRIDQVQQIRVPVLRRVIHRNGMALNRNALLALEIHRVQELILHPAQFHRFRMFEQTVGERRFPVVDVSDDTKVANIADLRH